MEQAGHNTYTPHKWFLLEKMSMVAKLIGQKKWDNDYQAAEQKKIGLCCWGGRSFSFTTLKNPGDRLPKETMIRTWREHLKIGTMVHFMLSSILSQIFKK